MKHNKGFTLIELMIVVAIVAIISMFAIPSYQNAQRKARITEGVAALYRTQSLVEKERLVKRLAYDKIEIETITWSPHLVYYNGTQLIYTIRYKVSDDIKHEGSNKYTLTASAQDNWLPKNDPCAKLILYSNGNLSPSECKK